MTPSGELFSLVKSLSKSEKRYLKLTAQIHRNSSNIIQLFDLIEHQEEYNEEEIKNQLKEKVLIRQLPVTKVALHQFIMKGLRSYHSGKTIDFEIKELILNAEILFSKGLYKLCSKTLSKAKQLSHKYEKHLYTLEILSMQEKINRALVDIKELENFAAAHKEELTALDHYKNICEYRVLSTRIFILNNKNTGIRGKKELSAYTSIVTNKLFKNEKEALSTKAKIFFFGIWGVYLTEISDYENSHKNYKKLFDLFESQGHLKLLETPNYIAILNNLALTSGALKKYDDLFFYTQKLREVPGLYKKNKPVLIESTVFVNSYLKELVFYSDTGRFTKAVTVIPTLEKGLKQFDESIDIVYKLLFKWNFACIYFGANEYNKSLKYLNQIINDFPLDVREEIHSFARILRIIIYYEMKDYEYLETVIQSTYRYLHRKNKLYALEALMLKTMKMIIVAESEKEKEKNFIQLKETLQKFLEDVFEKFSFSYFDFISWTESKIQHKPFAEIVRKKAGK